MSKTILQWLQEIPNEKVRERAIRNIDPDWKMGEGDPKTERSALAKAFRFGESPEGADYWFLVCQRKYTEAESLLNPPQSEERIKCSSCEFSGDSTERKENAGGDWICPKCGDLVESVSPFRE